MGGKEQPEGKKTTKHHSGYFSVLRVSHYLLLTFYVIKLKKINKSAASQMALVVKNLPASAGDPIPGLGKSSERRYGNNPMDRRAWWATVHRIAVRHD